jgi:hypothetical protein
MSPKDWFSSATRTLAILVALVMVGSSVSAAEWNEKVLYSFQGGNDGAVPAGGVVFDMQGNLYGATTYTSSCPTTFDCGTVFELSPPQRKGGAWTETSLHVFQGHDQDDGGSPEGGVILDAGGNLYGTTAYGGSGPCILLGTAVGCGTVYEIVPPKQKGGAWTEKVLYSFRGNKDGQFPWGDLVFDAAGNLYGATQFGGGYGSCDAPFYQHCGTIFKLSPPKTMGGKWTEKVLYSFRSGADGANPNGGLILDDERAVYGTTLFGGNSGCKSDSGIGCGTAFQLKPPTRKGGIWRERMLHRFADGEDGAGPNGGLIFDAKGSLYGTTGGGGIGACGLAFRLKPVGGDRWVEDALYDFAGGSDGCGPGAGLLFDSLGSLYGTSLGGRTFLGVVFRLKPPMHGSHWPFTLLYNFTGAPDGNHPTASLVFDNTGSLYSTSQWGGTAQSCQGGCGTVFKVTP